MVVGDAWSLLSGSSHFRQISVTSVSNLDWVDLTSLSCRDVSHGEVRRLGDLVRYVNYWICEGFGVIERLSRYIK